MILIKLFKQFIERKNRKRVREHFRRVREVLRYRYFFNPMAIDMGERSHINPPALIFGQKNIHLGNNCNIDWECKLYCTTGRFIMKDNSGAAAGLTVIANNHVREVGEKKGEKGNSNLVGKDILVEEDVWIGANVTLLAGCHIGRGAIIGAGSVLRTCKVPPYAIVIGNPAKIIGFRYTPEQIVEHEKILYQPEDRIPIEKLKQNYNKYFIKRINEIKTIVTL